MRRCGFRLKDRRIGGRLSNMCMVGCEGVQSDRRDETSRSWDWSLEAGYDNRRRCNRGVQSGKPDLIFRDSAASPSR